MASKHRATLPLLVATAVIVGLVSPSGASALVGTPKYPDLRAMPPIDLSLGQTTVGSEQHHTFSFTVRTYNAGPGALEVDRVPQVVPASGLADLKQRIYEDPAGFQDKQLATVALTSPYSFEIPDFARFELWTQREFTRAQRSGFTRGMPLYTLDGASYCVSSDAGIDPNASTSPYVSCKFLSGGNAPVVEGISPGWADQNYPTIDLGTAPLPDGKYVIRHVADPDNLLWESPNKADPAKESQLANAGYSAFEIINGVIAWNG